jgi:hypothetical protein
MASESTVDYKINPGFCVGSVKKIKMKDTNYWHSQNLGYAS